MKRAKRALIVLSVMMLAFVLCGCGNDNKKVIGTWETTVDLTPQIEEGLGEEFEGFHAPFDVVVKITFNEDGTFEAGPDKDQTEATLENWINALLDFSVEMTYSQMAEMGYDQAQAEEMFQQAYGASVRDYLEQTVRANLDKEALTEDTVSSGVYAAKGKKLYMNDGDQIELNKYDLFTVEGDILTLDAATEEIAAESELFPGFSYPFVFTRSAE